MAKKEVKNIFQDLGQKYEPITKRNVNNIFEDLGISYKKSHLFEAPDKLGSELKNENEDDPKLSDVLWGLHDAPLNIGANLGNFLTFGKANLPIQKNSSGPLYEGAKLLADIGTTALGGPILGSLGLAGKAASLSSKISPLLGKLIPSASRVLGSSLFGASQDPINPLQGAILGGSIQGLGETAPDLYTGIKNKFNSQETFKNLKKELSGNGIEKNREIIADMIKKIHKNKSSPISEGFNNLLSNGNNRYIPYENFQKELTRHSTGIGRKNTLSKNIYNLRSSIENSENEEGARKIIRNNFPFLSSDVHAPMARFFKNPNLDNAHKLQSSFSRIDRSLESGEKMPGGLSESKRIEKSTIQNIREALLSDIHKELGESAPIYKELQGKWANIQELFNSKKWISDILNNKTQSLSGISSKFKNPQNKFREVVDLLGSDANKIILNEALSGAKTPRELIDLYQNLPEKELGYYKTPEYDKKILEELSKKLKNKKTAKILAGLSLSLMGHGNPLLSIAYGGAGLAGSHFLKDEILKNLTDLIPKSIRKIPGKIYRKTALPILVTDKNRSDSKENTK